MNLKPNHLIASEQVSFMTTVLACFANDTRQYAYKVERAWYVQKGDSLVVKTLSGTKVVTVVEVHEEPEINFEAPFNYAWAVCKLDFSVYEARKEQEAELERTMLKDQKALLGVE